jgi:hypothetical protein
MEPIRFHDKIAIIVLDNQPALLPYSCDLHKGRGG